MTIRNILTSITALFLTIFIVNLAGCSDSKKSVAPQPLTSLELNLKAFTTLSAGEGFYEVWAVNGTAYTSLGKFNVNMLNAIVDTLGNAITKFNSPIDMAASSRIAVTVEPANDLDAGPSLSEILSGTISGNTATMVFVNDYSKRAGNFIIITPSDSGGGIFPPAVDPTNPYSGIWFANKPWGTPEPGFDLDTLSQSHPQLDMAPAGWKYEGWHMNASNMFISTGKFTQINLKDEGNPYISFIDSAAISAKWHFPGEDFLQNPPAGFTFPLDVRGGMVFVTLEPEPDNSPEPFLTFILFCKEINVSFVSNVVYSLFVPETPSAIAVLK